MVKRNCLVITNLKECRYGRGTTCLGDWFCQGLEITLYAEARIRVGVVRVIGRLFILVL